MTGKTKKMTPYEKSQFLWGWGFILPTIIGLLVLNIIPMIQTVYQSLNKTGDFGRGNIFVGLKNYQKIMADGQVWQALINTFKYAVVEVPVSVVVALILAAMLNQKLKGRNIYRTIFFLPMVTAPAASAMVWRWLYNSDYGLINNLFHIHVNWISNPKIAVFSIAMIGAWSVLGYNMVLFISGLQEVPRDYYEAAQIDGADGVAQFFSITLPLISPTIFFVMVTRIINAFQVFDLIFMVMDPSNPALDKTWSLVYLFYRYSFEEKNRGYGSAIVVILVVAIMIITVIQMKAQKKWVHYE